MIFDCSKCVCYNPSFWCAMKFNPASNSPQGRQLLRGVAVMLLLLVCADVVLPQPCCTGAEVPPAQTADLTESINARVLPHSTVPGASAHQSGPKQPPDIDHCDDNCLCCGHAAPCLRFNVQANPDQKLLVMAVKHDALPAPPLPGTFHPPRYA
jgi:hypothetical protein